MCVCVCVCVEPAQDTTVTMIWSRSERSEPPESHNQLSRVLRICLFMLSLSLSLSLSLFFLFFSLSLSLELYTWQATHVGPQSQDSYLATASSPPPRWCRNLQSPVTVTPCGKKEQVLQQASPKRPHLFYSGPSAPHARRHAGRSAKRVRRCQHPC